MLARDAKRVFDERRCSDAAEADDDRRIDECDLPLQPFAAALLLRKLRVAVVRRTAFDNVGDVDLGAVQINHLEHVVEQLSGRADKRHALAVLLLTRAFANEHDACVFCTVSEHEAVPRLAEAAAMALRARLLELFPGFIHPLLLLFV